MVLTYPYIWQEHCYSSSLHSYIAPHQHEIDPRCVGSETERGGGALSGTCCCPRKAASFLARKSPQVSVVEVRSDSSSWSAIFFTWNKRNKTARYTGEAANTLYRILTIDTYGSQRPYSTLFSRRKRKNKPHDYICDTEPSPASLGGEGTSR